MGRIIESLASGIGVTVAITVAAFVLGAILGLPIAIMRRSRAMAVRAPAIAFVETVRAIPPIVWLFIVYFGIGTDVVKLTTYEAAVLGLGLISAAYLSEIYRAGIDSVPRGQWDAAAALALPGAALYRKVVLPQAVLVVIPPAATFAIGLLKDSAIASVIGAQDITFRAFQETQATLQGLTIFGIAGLMYIAMSVPVAILARYSDRVLARRVAA